MHKPPVILITGASTGIGHATAKALIADGHIVYGAARRVHLMDDLVAAGERSEDLPDLVAVDPIDLARVGPVGDRRPVVDHGETALGQLERRVTSLAARVEDVDLDGTALAAVRVVHRCPAVDGVGVHGDTRSSRR